MPLFTFMKKFTEYLEEKELINNSIINPDTLLKWLTKNIEYQGIPKHYLYTPEQVIQKRKGHCWEISELAYQELTNLGYECQLLYLETKSLSMTHTTIIYKHKDTGHWSWFEPVITKHIGIHGSFPTALDCAEYIKKQLLEPSEVYDMVYMGYSPITTKTTQMDYINNIKKHWKALTTNLKK